MGQNPKVIRSKSRINYSYATIKITQSRLDKALIAIPVALAEWFPDHNETIQVYLNNSPLSQTKRYSSYSSSTRECRIGGMREWFQQNDIKSGGEIVIQLIDKENFTYRLIPERNFILKTEELQYNFDNSETEQEASEKITTLAQWTDLDKNTVTLNEYYRLTNILPIKDRQYINKHPSRAGESVPSNLRTLLEHLYRGKCQVCNFGFLKRDKRPYFEIHHLDPLKGHYPQNLLVVCANCHNQFEYADVQHEFNNEGWLTKVSFNGEIYSVNQILVETTLGDYVKKLFI